MACRTIFGCKFCFTMYRQWPRQWPQIIDLYSKVWCFMHQSFGAKKMHEKEDFQFKSVTVTWLQVSSHHNTVHENFWLCSKSLIVFQLCDVSNLQILSKVSQKMHKIKDTQLYFEKINLTCESFKRCTKVSFQFMDKSNVFQTCRQIARFKTCGATLCSICTPFSTTLWIIKRGLIGWKSKQEAWLRKRIWKGVLLSNCHLNNPWFTNIALCFCQ